MARAITYLVIAGLGLFVLTTTFLVSKGGGSANPNESGQVISVHDLSLDPPEYTGDTLTTVGQLMFSPDIKQYQVVDEGIAIVVVGYEDEALRELDGQRVRVTGRFDFDIGTGIFIDAELVAATAAP
jgi:hypothetical protein